MEIREVVEQMDPIPVADLASLLFTWAEVRYPLVQFDATTGQWWRACRVAARQAAEQPDFQTVLTFRDAVIAPGGAPPVDADPGASFLYGVAHDVMQLLRIPAEGGWTWRRNRRWVSQFGYQFQVAGHRMFPVGDQTPDRWCDLFCCVGLTSDQSRVAIANLPDWHGSLADYVKAVPRMMHSANN